MWKTLFIKFINQRATEHSSSSRLLAQTKARETHLPGKWKMDKEKGKASAGQGTAGQNALGGHRPIKLTVNNSGDSQMNAAGANTFQLHCECIHTAA